MGETTGHVWRIRTRVGIWFRSLSLLASVLAMACSIVDAKIKQKRWDGPLLGIRSGFDWTYGMLWVCAHHPAFGVYWESTGRNGELFFFLIKKEPFAPHKGSGCSSPCVPEETLKASALIGLHLMAAEKCIWICQDPQMHQTPLAWGCLNGATNSSKKNHVQFCFSWALHTSLCNAWQANAFRTPQLHGRATQKSMCDVAHTDSPTQHTKCIIHAQRKARSTEECLIV